MVKVQNDNECYSCSCWDSDREGCTMPSVDRVYACPLYSDENDCIDEIFLMQFSVSIRPDKEKLLCDYTFNKGFIENENVVSDLSQKLMQLIQNSLFEECDKNVRKNR